MTLNENEGDLKVLLEEIKKTRNELKNYIEASETKILMKIETLNEKIKNIEKESEFIKNKIEYLERGLKRNSILVYGLDLNENLTAEIICEKLSHLLEINVIPEDINDFYTLNIPNKPLKLDLISNLTKKSIFSNCRKLKGTNISITNDLTYQQRQDQKILRQYLKKSREDTETKSYIRGEKLYIGNNVYTAETLKTLKENPGKSVGSSLTLTKNIRRDITIRTNISGSEEGNSTNTEEHQESSKSKNLNQKTFVVKPTGTSTQTSFAAGREKLRSYNKYNK